MSNEENSEPEWQFFARLEKLEALKPTAEDGRILAMEAFVIAFIALARHRPTIARKAKDLLIARLKKLGLTAGLLGQLERDLLEICDEVEQHDK